VRSRSRENKKYKKRSRSDSRNKSSNQHESRESSNSAEKTEVHLTGVEEARRQKLISDIESENFVQQSFRSETRSVTIKADNNDEVEEVGQFGTAGEVATKNDIKSKKDKLNSEGLINPDFFGDQEERETRYLAEIFSIRQKHLTKRAI